MVKDKKQYTMHNGLAAVREEQKEQTEQQKFPTSLPSCVSVEQERDSAIAILQETKQQLMRLHKMKSDTLSMLSYEFRTALATIHDFSEMICDERASITDMRELATDIRADARRLTLAIHDILERERLESESTHLAVEWLDLNAIIIDAVERVRPLLGRHNVYFSLAHVLPILQGDHEKLTQVIVYLLSNVIKYAVYEGDICVRSYIEGHVVHVCVQRQGSSTHIDAKNHHCEENTQTDAETMSSSSPSSPLPVICPGLRAVRQIVQLHGGQLWSENSSAEGPTFHFTVRFASMR